MPSRCGQRHLLRVLLVMAEMCCLGTLLRHTTRLEMKSQALATQDAMQRSPRRGQGSQMIEESGGGGGGTLAGWLEDEG